MLDALTDLAGAWSCKLFKNDYTPVAGSINTSFTESDFAGYAAVALAAANFPNSTTVSNIAESAYDTDVTFTCSGSATQNVYGFYVLSGTTLVFSERFAAGPYAMALNGDKIVLRPTLKLSTA